MQVAMLGSRGIAGILKTPRGSTATVECNSGDCSGIARSSTGSSSMTHEFFLPLDEGQAVGAATAAVGGGHAGAAGSRSSSRHIQSSSHPGIMLSGSVMNSADDSPSSSSGNSGSGVKKKRALFIDPTCQPHTDVAADSSSSSSRAACSSSQQTGSMYVQGSTSTLCRTTTSNDSSTGSSQTSRAYGLPNASPDLNCSGSSSSLRPGGDCCNIQFNSGGTSRQSSCQMPCKTPRGSIMREPFSSSSNDSLSTPGGKTSSQTNNANNNTRGPSRGGGSNSGSLSCIKHYGAWYLKTAEWAHVNTAYGSHKSTWQRQSQHVTDIDEQQRFAEQLQQLADPTDPDPTAAAAVEALATIVEGLASNSEKNLSSVNPTLLITNTWAVGCLTVTGESRTAEDEAALAMQAYYKQLHEAAKQQAKLNAQVKGSYGLRAYKDYMQSKGFRQSSSLQRLPTPTDEEIHLAALKQQQDSKEQQQLERQLSRRQQHQAGPDSLHGSKRGSRNRTSRQQQQQQHQHGRVSPNSQLRKQAGGKHSSDIDGIGQQHHHQQQQQQQGGTENSLPLVGLPNMHGSKGNSGVQAMDLQQQQQEQAGPLMDLQQQQQGWPDSQPGSNCSSGTGALGTQQQQQQQLQRETLPDGPGSKQSISSGEAAAWSHRSTAYSSCGTDADDPAAAADEPAARYLDSSNSGQQSSAAAAAVASVPKLNLSEVHRAARQLHELKKACHSASGLDSQDFDQLQALLTSGRRSVITSSECKSSAGAVGSSSARSCSTTRCCSTSYFGGNTNSCCSSHSRQYTTQVTPDSGTVAGSTTPTASAVQYRDITVPASRSPPTSFHCSGSKSARAALGSISSRSSGGGGGSAGAAADEVAQMQPRTMHAAECTAAGQHLGLEDEHATHSLTHQQQMLQQQQQRQRICCASTPGRTCIQARGWQVGSCDEFFDSPLCTQSINGIACDSSNGSNGRMTASSIISPTRHGQQQQQQWVALLSSKQQQQVSRSCSTAGSTGGSGRLSPYACSLLAPVTARLHYLLTPRPAGGVSGGSAVADLGSLAGSRQHTPRQHAPRSSRLGCPSCH